MDKLEHQFLNKLTGQTKKAGIVSLIKAHPEATVATLGGTGLALTQYLMNKRDASGTSYQERTSNRNAELYDRLKEEREARGKTLTFHEDLARAKAKAMLSINPIMAKYPIRGALPAIGIGAYVARTLYKHVPTFIDYLV